MTRHSLLLIALIIIGFQTFAQDKMVLINGRVVELKNYNVTDEYILYNRKQDTRAKQRVIEKVDVFSILKTDGSEEIVYGDTINGLSLAQARNFIRGEQAAMRFYNRQAHIGESAIVGMASSILVFYSLPVPMFNAVILGRFSPKKMQIPEGYDAPYSATEEYKAGYEKKARNLKIQQSIKWGYIGLGVGLVGFIAYYATGGD
jgi:hypothetical protein